MANIAITGTHSFSKLSHKNSFENWGFPRFHIGVPDVQMNCSDLTWRSRYQGIAVTTMAAKQHAALSVLSMGSFWEWARPKREGVTM